MYAINLYHLVVIAAQGLNITKGTCTCMFTCAYMRMIHKTCGDTSVLLHRQGCVCVGGCGAQQEEDKDLQGRWYSILERGVLLVSQMSSPVGVMCAHYSCPVSL